MEVGWWWYVVEPGTWCGTAVATGDLCEYTGACVDECALGWAVLSVE